MHRTPYPPYPLFHPQWKWLADCVRPCCILLLAWGFIGAWATLLTASAAPATAPLPAAPLDGNCLAAIARAEQAERLPQNLLLAVALTESGRRTQSGFLPWPWTLNVDGRGLYLDSRQEAERWAERLFAEGARNIDFGCMQVSSLYHPQAFLSIRQALDPALNTAYAARFLRSLYQQTGSWEQAVARYHSADTERGGAYRQRVLAALRGDLGPAQTYAEEIERLQGPLLAASRLISNDPAAAADSFGRYLADHPADPVALAGRALALQRSGQGQAAYGDLENLYLSSLTKAGPSAPQTRQAWQQLVRLLGSLPAAERIKRLEYLTGLYGDDSRPHEWLVRDSLASGDDPRALRHKQALIRLHPKEGRLYLDAAVIARRIGDHTQAQTLARQALALPAAALNDSDRQQAQTLLQSLAESPVPPALKSDASPANTPRTASPSGG
ncbi:transglycosylase SLT domain-containing protein [Insolitispirillum peregrinum]|uniref:transglycosylase SLT domain-containing protein n=1 Tax=Insolitispirillum peregrinum TaxID=80876 RepID=UPI0036D27B3C